MTQISFAPDLDRAGCSKGLIFERMPFRTNVVPFGVAPEDLSERHRESEDGASVRIIFRNDLPIEQAHNLSAYCEA